LDLVCGIITVLKYILESKKIIPMASRGDNNKTGSAGRGASNQSNQGFESAASREKSNYGDQTDGKRSEPERKTKDQSSNRNTSTNGAED
jgi:hypothetical protein